MEIHERFIKFPTLDLSLFKALDSTAEEEPLILIHRFISYYNEEVTKCETNLKTLDIFRSLLCQKYQVLFQCQKETEKTCSTPESFDIAQRIIATVKCMEDKSKLIVYYDILMLELVLHCNINCIQQHLENHRMACSDEVNTCSMKILDCFLQACQLRDFLFHDVGVQIREHLSTIYMSDIITWLETKEEKEWRIFAIIFPRLVKFFGPGKILPRIWQFFLDDSCNIKDTFAALCIIADILFPLDAQNVNEVNYSLCHSDKMWLMLRNGLRSPEQQYRKQALFLLRKIVKFVDASKLELKELEVRPFLCTELTTGMVPMSMLQEKFFLVFEALEQKQQHLIVPALCHVPSLIEGYKQHSTNHDCFDIVWIEIIFQRMMQHENNAIVRRGIEYVCSFENLMLREKFCKLFFTTLNNTFLYESFNSGSKIRFSIEALLKTDTLQDEPNFLPKILRVISQIEWAPVPLFYTLEVLENVFNKSRHNQLLDDTDLATIKVILQRHLKKHSDILRYGSQFVLLKLLMNSMTEVIDLYLLSNTLYEFSSEICILATHKPSDTWLAVREWSEKLITCRAAENTLTKLCDKYSTETVHPSFDTDKLAFFICFLHTANLMFAERTCRTEQILTDWLSCLDDIDERPYAHLESTLNAIEVVAKIFHYRLETQFLLPHVTVIMKFLLKNFKSFPSKETYDNVQKYIKITELFLEYYYSCPLVPLRERADCLQKFLHESCDILSNINDYNSLTSLCALRVLNFCSTQIEIPSYPDSVIHVRKIKISDDVTVDPSLRGKVNSEYNLQLMKLMKHCIKRSVIKTEWAENILHLFDLGGKEIIPPTGEVLKAVLDFGLLSTSEDRSQFESIFEMCWHQTFLDKRNSLFWPSIRILTKVIVYTPFLKLPQSFDFANQYVCQLLEESEKLPKLKRILVTCIHELQVAELKSFPHVLISGLTHGQALRRDQKIEKQALMHIAQHYIKFLSEAFALHDANVDAMIRAYSIKNLLNILGNDAAYATEFLDVVLQELDKYRNKRYYNYSYIHKVKNRIMQALLLLQNVLDETGTLTLQNSLFSLILSESNQHSVRLMQEWLLIRIFLKYPNHHSNLWRFFEEAIEVRPASTTAAISVVYHTSQLLPKKLQREFLETGLKYIARCCLGQKFSMRLYGQIFFIKLYNKLKLISCTDVTSKYLGLYEATLRSVEEGNTLKNSKKVLADFYFAVFHPIKHYTLETVYYDLPRLSGMDEGEWLDPQVLEELGFIRITRDYGEGDDSHANIYDIYNSNLELCDIRTTPYVAPVTLGNDCENEPEGNSDRVNDIQKKNDGSSATANIGDDFALVSRNSPEDHQHSDQEEGLIVVASLIDRLPNLGGLARTCEIFRAKALVVNNLGITKEKEFQSLCVSADKWIAMKEVKPYKLQEYLLKKKDEGWTLVGIEQTAYSTNLTSMKFDPKTILVLGNEKDGVPANLIPLFDTCVEIPQAGIIRSLNVHVTGGICIWEYAKQHIFENV